MPATPASGLESALGSLRFTSPVVIVSAPAETNRLFVVEQPGRIVVITNLSAPTRTTFLDLTSATISGGEQGLLGLAFHPRYAENGRFFIFRTVTASTRGSANRRHDRLSEFRVAPDNPNRASSTERILFQQNDEASNHNGGDLQFGPDGYLYVALGDEGGANDQYRNGQTITRDFFAGILRLDVDARPGSVPPNPHPANEDFPGNYHIPADNPYVGATEFLGQPISDPLAVRTEFYAVGLRNPWRISFDPVSGELWVADVGQGAREAVFISRRGANHGWPFREGPLAGPRTGAPAGFTTNPTFQHVAPLHSYSHGSGPNQGRSITGGFVYRGSRFPELRGAYVFADYVSGNLWVLRRQPAGPPQIERLLGEVGISSFGRDPRDGDVLIADLDGGRILRLVPGAAGGQPIPPTLGETGAFSNLETLSPTEGVVPYDVNLSFWSDGAQKRRWFHVPGTNRLTFATTGAWLAPTGSVWIKHFDLPAGQDPAGPRRRVETRFLVRNAAGVYGVTYKWTSANNAVLVADEGESATFVIEGSGGELAQTVNWRFPSRAECLACHNTAAGGTLSFETAQLARSIPSSDGTEVHQIRALADAGYFHNPPAHPSAYRRHPSMTDERVSLEARARSYLAVNCAPCHRPGGTVGGGFFDARLETMTDAAELILGRLNDTGNDPETRLVVPGSPEKSELIHRMRDSDATRMPPISSGVPDVEGIALMERWVRSLPGRNSFTAWLRERFPPGIAEEASLTRDADADGASDYLEFLTGTDPMRDGDGWRLSVSRKSPGPGWNLRYRQPAGVGVALETADSAEGPWSPWAPANSSLGPTIAFEAGDVEVGLDTTPDVSRFLRARIIAP